VHALDMVEMVEQSGTRESGSMVMRSRAPLPWRTRI
jgi:hypothetical protein